MMHGGLHHVIIDAAAQTVFVSSVLHSLLPPWDGFADYPKFQRKYKLFIYIIGYIALNGRSTVYQKIGVGQQVAKAEEAAAQRTSSATTMSVSVRKPKDI